MDYSFASWLTHFLGIRLVFIGYDIVCQWYIHLFDRSLKWPLSVALDPAITITPAIGLFHEPAHRTADHEQFSPNFIKGVGLTDFENQERVWSAHNTLGNSTRTMGPGSRHDILMTI
jgi:hypothetical protein